MFSFEQATYKNILSVPSLTIHEKEITCIVGESGSGKTTLLRMLNHLISPDGGRITFQNRNLMDIDPVELRREVVMLPQTPVIFQGTIRDNLEAGLRFSEKGLPSEKELEKTLKKVNLLKALDVNAQNLSGGEKQRLALGRILLMEPKVLLLDEPSSALDDETESLIIQTFVDYAKAHHKTLVMVTHSKSLAKNFADRILQVRGGEVHEWNY
ncbi:ABC transporter ATP-binding protein [Isachenkonia alkalipeptolytica]|uniref:ATP-binding cassette domain-containing protein n=1 Tax=Isachenkonia alkalipeptolytica TaxID=2565777 RepID=A0AA43XN06_9CLOT|nr:ATP-binding cassette domain-containing protein [Isachenkonia alkalipeptolytica]NBG89461.1 ATP-binding cassette domain-containing protein [Isachenkonia alkalipeptolytica]